MSLIKQFAGQAISYGVATILSRIVYYLIVVVILTRILGARTAEFATYSYYYAFAAVLVTLFSFRLDTALFRFGNKNEKLGVAFGSAMIPVIIASGVLILLGTFAADLIARLSAFPEHPQYVRWFSYILAFDILNLIPFAKLRLENQVSRFVMLKVFNVVLSSVLILFFLVVLPIYKDSHLAFFPQLGVEIEWVFIANLIASFGLFLFLLPTILSLPLTVDKALIKKMFYYSYPLVIVGLANGFIQFFNTPLQEKLLSGSQLDKLGEAGVYDSVRRIAGLFVMFTTAFNYAAEPFFFNNSSQVARETIYGKISRLYMLVGGLVVIGMYLGLDLIKYILDSHYREGLYMLPILLIAYLLLGLYYNISIWYKLADRTLYGALFSLIGMAITAGISIIFLPTIGSIASAWSSLFSYLAMVLIAYVVGQKFYPIPYPVRHLLQDLTLIIVILFLAYFIREHLGILTKYMCYLALLVGYISYAWYSEKEEWTQILGRST